MHFNTPCPKFLFPISFFSQALHEFLSTVPTLGKAFIGANFRKYKMKLGKPQNSMKI